MKVIKKRILKIILSFIVFCFFITSLDFYIENLTDEKNTVEELPDISLLTVSNDTINISGLKNQVILFDFWFGNCLPCLKEMKYFPELFEKYKDRITIISFSIDKQSYTKRLIDDKLKPWDFLEPNNPNWIFCNANPKNSKSLNALLEIYQYPTYFLIDKDGSITKPKSGIYGIEKTLSGPFTIGITLKRYIQTFEIMKLQITSILYLILLFLFLGFKWLRNRFKKK